MAKKNAKIFIWLLAGFLAGFLSGAAVVVWQWAPPTALLDSGPAPSGPQPLNQAQVAQAIAVLEQDIQAAPQDPQPLLRLGGLLIDLGRFQEAAGYFQKALDLSGPQAAALTDLGYCLRETGRPQEALAMFEQAIQLDAGQKSAYYNAGIVALYDLDDQERALNYFETYLRLDPPPDSQLMVQRLVAQLKSGRAAPLP